jgi:hypothetical protein
MSSIKHYSTIFCILTVIFCSNYGLFLSAQNIPLILKKKYQLAQKLNFEDTISRRTKTDFPYIVGYNYIPYKNEYNHPYFKDNKWANGSLLYNGKSYKVDGLKYDIAIDKLIILFNNNDLYINNIALDENFIDEFTIQNSHFKYFNDLKSNSGKKLKTGYYEVVYNGKLKFLVRSEKYKIINDFTLSFNMFLLKDGVMITINSMGKLISLLKDKEKEVKSFINDNSLTLNQMDYYTASKVLNFYENL